MFCGNCGKQLPEGSKFCKYCGASTGAPVVSTNSFEGTNSQPIGLLIVMAILTVYVAIGGLRPIASVGAFGYEQTFSIKDIWDLLDVLEAADIRDESYQKFQLLIGFSALASLASAIFGGVFLGRLVCGSKGEKLTNPIRYCMWCQMIAVVVIALLIVDFNNELAEYSYGVNLLEFTMEGWMLLILPWVNIFCARAYEE